MKHGHICAEKKIQFFKTMLEKHKSGILWVDVDTRIIKKPILFENAKYDMAIFLGAFRNLKDYDPVQAKRTFHPGFIHFNGTEKTHRFVDHMARLERDSTANGTDAYFLEEAWRSFEEPLNVMVLSRDLLAMNEDSITEYSLFLFGDSGNVPAFQDLVEQHSARLFENRRQITLLRNYALTAKKGGKLEQAEVFLSKAHKIDPKDSQVAVSLGNLLVRMGKSRSAIQVIKDSFGDQIVTSTEESIYDPLRIIVEASLQIGDWKRALVNVRRIEKIDLPEAKAYALSRLSLIEMERRAELLKLGKADRPKLYWMDTPYPGNFGDVLNPYLFEKLSGVPPLKAHRNEGILSVGSIIKFARKGSIVWGSGTPRMTDTLSPDADYRAVRGPLTQKLIAESGGTPPDTIGDPAMLLPLIFQPKVAKKYRLGIIRHHSHEPEPLDIDPSVKDISILRVGDRQIEEFITELNECEAILSTSLHGLIVAHAYGIPTRWCTLSKAAAEIPGDFTKFHDHYAAFGIDCREPLDLSALTKIDDSLYTECTEVVTREFNARDFLKSFPFKLLPEYT